MDSEQQNIIQNRNFYNNKIPDLELKVRFLCNN